MMNFLIYLKRYLKELLVGTEEEIHITFEDVKRINEAAFKEKGRC